MVVKMKSKHGMKKERKKYLSDLMDKCNKKSSLQLVIAVWRRAQCFAFDFVSLNHAYLNVGPLYH